MKKDFIMETFIDVDGKKKTRLKQFRYKKRYYYADWKGNLFLIPSPFKNAGEFLCASLFPEFYYENETPFIN
jgi:hypothetical protein